MTVRVLVVNAKDNSNIRVVDVEKESDVKLKKGEAVGHVTPLSEVQQHEN